ncbi:MAG: hypothetical protein GX549_02930 [Clostridiales bacterium]|nr:hypothetical protein [Clostridiales bacterium]
MDKSPRQRMIDTLWGRGERVPVAYWHTPGRPPLSGLEEAVALCAAGLTRVEHPHCAITHAPVSRDGVTGTASVLHTPEGRLTQECFPDPDSGLPVIRKHFVTRPAHYGPLLSYLRDASVAPDYRPYIQADEALGELGLPLVSSMPTPMAHLAVRYRCARELASDRQADTEAVRQCIHHLRRLFREQTEALVAARESASFRAVMVPDELDAQLLSDEDFGKFCLPRYRELLAALPGAAVMVEAAGRVSAGWEFPAAGCLMLPPDAWLPPGEALSAWPGRSVLATLPRELISGPAAHITEAVAALAALPGASARLAVAMPPGLSDEELIRCVPAALDGAEY